MQRCDIKVLVMCNDTHVDAGMRETWFQGTRGELNMTLCLDPHLVFFWVCLGSERYTLLLYDIITGVNLLCNTFCKIKLRIETNKHMYWLYTCKPHKIVSLLYITVKTSTFSIMIHKAVLNPKSKIYYVAAVCRRLNWKSVTCANFHYNRESLDIFKTSCLKRLFRCLKWQSLGFVCLKIMLYILAVL